MQLDLSIRRRLQLQNYLFLLLFSIAIGLLAWLSNRYTFTFDWTVSGRNTLSEVSQTLLDRLHDPIKVTAYTRDNPALRQAITRLIARYRRHKTDMELYFVNPDTLPQQIRELGITADGELYLEYQGRGERVRQISEQTLTQSLQRLSRQKNRLVRFLEGHGERQLLGIANHDLGNFGKELLKTGIRLQSINLSQESVIPTDTDTLIIADPQIPLSSTETQALLNYIKQGGHLLWLLDIHDKSGLKPLATMLGIRILPGTVIDPGASDLGIDNPTFIPIADYDPHSITNGLHTLTLLPQTVALHVHANKKWAASALLRSQPSAWTETGTPDKAARFNPDNAEHSGPLTVAVALSRPHSSGSSNDNEQRIVIIGDSDFLSNTYLGNGANLELGLNTINWLIMDDVLVTIPSRIVNDPYLEFSEHTLALLAALFLFGLPGVLLGSGWLIWFYRRRR